MKFDCNSEMGQLFSWRRAGAGWRPIRLQLGHPLFALLGDPDRIFAAVGYRRLGLKPFPLFQPGDESAGCGLSETELFPDGRPGSSRLSR